MHLFHFFINNFLIMDSNHIKVDKNQQYEELKRYHPTFFFFVCFSQWHSAKSAESTQFSLVLPYHLTYHNIYICMLYSRWYFILFYFILFYFILFYFIYLRGIGQV